MLSLALGASLILAWQPLDPAARQAPMAAAACPPRRPATGSPVTAPSRVEVVSAFRLGAPPIACLDCAPAPIVEALPAEAAPEALRLVPHMSSGTSLSRSSLHPFTARAERERPLRGLDEGPRAHTAAHVARDRAGDHDPAMSRRLTSPELVGREVELDALLRVIPPRRPRRVGHRDDRGRRRDRQVPAR